MWVRLNKRRFRHVEKPLSGENAGYCDNPETPHPKVVVDSRLKGKKALRIRIHEWMHGQQWHVSEEYIDLWSSELADALWAKGYRMEAE